VTGDHLLQCPMKWKHNSLNNTDSKKEK